MLDQEGIDLSVKTTDATYAWKLIAAAGWILALLCLLRIIGVFGGSCTPV